MVAPNEPLIGCGPLPDWLRKIRCIYAIDTFDDNFCVWRCLAIRKQKDIKRGTEFITKAALNLAREYYGDNKLKRKDVRPTKLVDFEGIGRHHNANIMLYEPKKDSGKDTGSTWWLVYGKIQHKSESPAVNMGLFQGHCFHIKKMDLLCKRWECKGCWQIFTRDENLIKHLKEGRYTRGKTKIICSGGQFRCILIREGVLRW